MPSPKSKSFDAVYWSQSGNRVLLIAKALASPNLITESELLSSLTTKPSLSSTVLAAAQIRTPHSGSPNYLETLKLPPSWHRADFSKGLQALFSNVLPQEARNLKEYYFGTHHILLALAQAGDQGIGLNYDTIFKLILDELYEDTWGGNRPRSKPLSHGKENRTSRVSDDGSAIAPPSSLL